MFMIKVIASFLGGRFINLSVPIHIKCYFIDT